MPKNDRLMAVVSVVVECLGSKVGVEMEIPYGDVVITDTWQTIAEHVIKALADAGDYDGGELDVKEVDIEERLLVNATRGPER